jgi:hypothetical protein
MNENRNNITWSCGCRLDGYTLTYCSLHNAAEDMYEALKALSLNDRPSWTDNLSEYWQNALKALEKAEGKT